MVTKTWSLVAPIVMMSLCTLVSSRSAEAGAVTNSAVVRLGPVYRIAEPDMLLELQAKLKAMQADGSLKRLQDEAVANALRSVARPAGMSLPRAEHTRVWAHDPTYIVPADIADHEGRKFAYAGDRINPLERGISLRNPLLFLNADDPVQLKALPKFLAQWSPKVILVQGDWKEVAGQIGRPVYFDQRGNLVKTFGISALPAVVEQAGTTLKVTEIVLQEGVRP